MLLLTTSAFAEDSQLPLLTDGFYANVKDAVKYASKDTTLMRITTNATESSITLWSVTSRNQFISDGYGINEIGGKLIAPVTFNYDSPQHYIASSAGCVATLTQKSANSFTISLNSEDSNDECFGNNGLFVVNGYIDKDMITDDTFTIDTNRSNIQTLHGQ